jgi:hypothetical protein
LKRLFIWLFIFHPLLLHYFVVIVFWFWVSLNFLLSVYITLLGY